MDTPESPQREPSPRQDEEGLHHSWPKPQPFIVEPPTPGRANNNGPSPRTVRFDRGRYAMATVNSVLPEYTNSDQDVVRCAFSPANCVSIAQLPSEIKYNRVSVSRSVKRLAALGCHRAKRVSPVAMARSRHDERMLKTQPLPSPRDYLAGAWPANCPSGHGELPHTSKQFSDFDYKFSPYNTARLLADLERQQHVHAQAVISETPFAPSDVCFKGKHETALTYTSEPYKPAISIICRPQRPNRFGPFSPATGSRGLSRTVGPKKLSSILTSLRKLLHEDWRLCSFTIHGSPNEPVTISFSLDTVESEASLKTYMNHMSKMNHIINDNNFVKMNAAWALKNGDGFIHFCFQPPWWIPPRPKNGKYQKAAWAAKT